MLLLSVDRPALDIHRNGCTQYLSFASGASQAESSRCSRLPLKAEQRSLPGQTSLSPIHLLTDTRPPFGCAERGRLCWTLLGGPLGTGVPGPTEIPCLTL